MTRRTEPGAALERLLDLLFTEGDEPLPPAASDGRPDPGGAGRAGCAATLFDQVVGKDLVSLELEFRAFLLKL